MDHLDDFTRLPSVVLYQAGTPSLSRHPIVKAGTRAKNVLQAPNSRAMILLQ